VSEKRILKPIVKYFVFYCKTGKYWLGFVWIIIENMCFVLLDFSTWI